MLTIFIAVFAVLLVMNVFMLIVLRQMTGATGRRIEKDAARLFGTYEELIGKKSGEVEELQQKKEELEASIRALKEEALQTPQTGSLPVHNPPVTQARFQEEDFFGTYSRIKESFLAEPKELVSRFKAEQAPETEEEAGLRRTLEHMRELLSFEVLYKLSILPLSLQRQVLSESFSGPEAKVYADWAQENAGGALEFSAWLKERSELLSDLLVVRTPEGGQKGETENTLWQEDGSICEGVKLRYKDRLYDYSV